MTRRPTRNAHLDTLVELFARRYVHSFLPNALYAVPRQVWFRRFLVAGEKEITQPDTRYAWKINFCIADYRQRSVRVQMLGGTVVRRFQTDMRLQAERRQLRRDFGYDAVYH